MAKTLSIAFSGATLLLAAICLSATGDRSLYLESPGAAPAAADLAPDSAAG